LGGGGGGGGVFWCGGVVIWWGFCFSVGGTWVGVFWFVVSGVGLVFVVRGRLGV